MSIESVAQLLSHYMSATIRTCMQTGQLQCNTSSNTTDFIEFIYHLFDYLNSRSLYHHNPYLCALTDSGSVKKKFYVLKKQKLHNISQNLQKLKMEN